MSHIFTNVLFTFVYYLLKHILYGEWWTLQMGASCEWWTPKDNKLLVVWSTTHESYVSVHVVEYLLMLFGDENLNTL
jgi:hypothetical protein